MFSLVTRCQVLTGLASGILGLLSVVSIACDTQESLAPSVTPTVSNTRSATEVPGLELRLEVGQPDDSGIPFQLVLSNVGDAGVEIGTGATDLGYGYDFVVNDAAGTEIWHWQSKPEILELVPLSLAPGEEKSFHGEWDRRDNSGDPAPAGRYRVTGVMRVTMNPSGAGDAVTLTTEAALVTI